MSTQIQKVYYHLPGLFEFYELYRVFLPLFKNHREYFYDWCEIGSIYGAPGDCIWGGGRVGYGDCDANTVYSLMQQYNISARLTFSNSLLKEEDFSDKYCNYLASLFNQSRKNGIIVHSDLLLEYLKATYPNLHYISSTTKVITEFDKFVDELKRNDFTYVVPDFRLNKRFDELRVLPQEYKDKVEFLCNECCSLGCKSRKECYENVSRKSLGEKCPDFICTSSDSEAGYMFSKAMASPAFVSISDIRDTYIPMGFKNFKIEGRSLGSALVLEMLLYYMARPEYQIHIREAIYLDNMLDLF